MVFKKPVPTELKTFQVPQTTGIPGWIVFTYNESIPVCLWITTHECEIITNCIVDELICGDTFLRVERLGKDKFVVSDIWVYNSNCVYVASKFSQRYEWLKKFLKTFTQTIDGFVQFIHKSDLSSEHTRGYEVHPEEVGKHGYFVEKEEPDVFKIKKMSIPDCYEVVGKGYLRVPDLKTSVYLRTKGTDFICRCKKYDEEFWDILENIPEIIVNA